jgi:hypothetical protein
MGAEPLAGYKAAQRQYDGYLEAAPISATRQNMRPALPLLVAIK